MLEHDSIFQRGKNIVFVEKSDFFNTTYINNIQLSVTNFLCLGFLIIFYPYILGYQITKVGNI